MRQRRVGVALLRQQRRRVERAVGRAEQQLDKLDERQRAATTADRKVCSDDGAGTGGGYFQAAIGSGAEELELLHCVVLVLLHTLEAQPALLRHAQPRKHAALSVTDPTVAVAAAWRALPITHDLGLRVLLEERAEVRQVTLKVK